MKTYSFQKLYSKFGIEFAMMGLVETEGLLAKKKESEGGIVNWKGHTYIMWTLKRSREDWNNLRDE